MTIQDVSNAPATEMDARQPHATPNSLVSLRGISKSFGGVTVLTDVDLAVSPGEVVAVIGPSGSGKSTMLRCINLLELPSAGSVTVAGKTVQAGQHLSAGQLLQFRRSIGMVFQSFNLFPHLTVLRNVSLAQERVLKRDRAEAEAVSMDLLKRVGLADKAHQYPNRCSGGQQQRIAIAR